jgi:dolichol kinase
LCFFIIIEILRRCISGFDARLFNAFKFIIKEKEKKGLLTTTLLILSVFLSVVLFRKDIAITAILFLIFGDAASAMVGSRFGRIKVLSRSLEGSLAFFITCLVIGTIINFTKTGLPWRVMFIGALAATVSELLPFPVDDNFTIALFSGIIMSLVSRI